MFPNPRRDRQRPLLGGRTGREAGDGLGGHPKPGRYERASTLLTSNRPVDDWGNLLGDTAAVTALLDRLLHHAHVLKCGPRSWRTKVHTDLRMNDATT